MVAILCALDVLHVSRVNKDSLSQQTLMELLVESMDDKQAFQDAHGIFRNITQWEGVEIEGQDVRKIDWSYDFADFISQANPMNQGGSMDLRWIPSNVIDFNVCDLEIRGKVATNLLPNCLKYLFLNANKFEGDFSIGGLPSNIEFVSIGFNNFSGSLTLPQLPPSIVSFNASQNQFSGSLQLVGLPPVIERLILSNNRFSGSICLESLPQKLKMLRLQSNTLYQEVLVINNPYNANIRIDKKSFHRALTLSGEVYRFSNTDTNSVFC